MKINVKISQEDIENGQRGDSGNCAIALALSKRGYRNVEVDVDSIDLCYQDKPYTTYALPYEMNSFIKDFDEGRIVTPTKFEFEVDEIVLDDWYLD